jgi:hypothetical protein
LGGAREHRYVDAAGLHQRQSRARFRDIPVAGSQVAEVGDANGHHAPRAQHLRHGSDKATAQRPVQDGQRVDLCAERHEAEECTGAAHRRQAEQTTACCYAELRPLCGRQAVAPRQCVAPYLFLCWSGVCHEIRETGAAGASSGRAP